MTGNSWQILSNEGFKGRIIYMTGYANEDIKSKRIKKDARNLLEKPFSLFSLSERIRELLDSDQSTS